MTEYNYFCYAKSYNDSNSFQQPRWRIFNKVVGETRYKELEKEIVAILPKQQNLSLFNYWKSITQDQWNKLLAIPEAMNFKEGFEYISGCKIEIHQPSLVGKTATVNIDGKTYSVTIQEEIK